MIRHLVYILLLGLTSFLFVVCGQSNEVPASEPTATPKPAPTATPKLAPTATSKPAPTATSKPAPTATSKPAPTATPKPAPTATPKPAPTATPKPAPTATPKPAPTATPKPAPTATPVPLLTAIDQEDLTIVKNHMAMGTDPNSGPILQGFPFEGAFPIHLAVLKNNREIVRVLLENGAQIDIKADNSDEATPLHWAAFYSMEDMVTFLISEGAPINALDANGTSPIDSANYAKVLSQGNPETLQKLNSIIEILESNGGLSAEELTRLSGIESTPGVESVEINTYGFKLIVDGSISIESSGLLADNAREQDGIVFFQYEGANTTLLWITGSDQDELLPDIYTQIVEAQPELTFSLINEGDIAVDSSQGKYLTFVANSDSGEVEAGGLTGVWTCPTDRVFSLTVTGLDPVVLQIRFKRLIDNFTCTP